LATELAKNKDLVVKTARLADHRRGARPSGSTALMCCARMFA
jgi:hypothetical protein